MVTPGMDAGDLSDIDRQPNSGPSLFLIYGGRLIGDLVPGSGHAGPNFVSIAHEERGVIAVSRCLAAAVAGVRFRERLSPADLTVGVASSRVRITFDVEDDSSIDDVRLRLRKVVDEVDAMVARERRAAIGGERL
jgi:hypothetical protein